MGMAFWIAFLPLLQIHKIERGQPKCVLTTVASTSYGHQCQFLSSLFTIIGLSQAQYLQK